MYYVFWGVYPKTLPAFGFIISSLFQAGQQSTVISELEDKVSFKNKLLRDMDSKKASLDKRLLEAENELARKGSDFETAVANCKDLRFAAYQPVRWFS